MFRVLLLTIAATVPVLGLKNLPRPEGVSVEELENVFRNSPGFEHLFQDDSETINEDSNRSRRQLHSDTCVFKLQTSFNWHANTIYAPEYDANGKIKPFGDSEFPIFESAEMVTDTFTGEKIHVFIKFSTTYKLWIITNKICTAGRCGVIGYFGGSKDATSPVGLKTIIWYNYRANRFEVSAAAQSSVTCVCASGQYSDGGSCTTYTNCAAGAFIKSYPTGLDDRKCEACPDGQFSTAVNSATCTKQKTCNPGQYVTQKGSKTQDYKCANCPSGQFTHSPNKDRCTPFSDCLPGTEVDPSFPGSSTLDRECLACENKKTFTDAKNLDQCIPCKPTCDTGEYIAHPCTTVGDIDCEPCPNCKQNEFLDAKCDGTEKEANCVACHASCKSCGGPLSTDCLTCPKNVKLHSSKDDSVMTQDGHHKGTCYTECPEGQYEDVDSEHLGQPGQELVCKNCDSSCIACTGQSNSDCTKCEPGMSLHEGKCVKREECPNGYFVAFPKGGTQEMCMKCDECDAATQYTESSCTKDMNTVCKSLSPECRSTQYEAVAATSSSDRQCYPCHQCPMGYETKIAASPDNDACVKSIEDCRMCTLYASYNNAIGQPKCLEQTRCQAGQQEIEPTTIYKKTFCEDCPDEMFDHDNDGSTPCMQMRQCKDHRVGDNGDAEYESVPGTATSDRVCTAISFCDLEKTYVSKPPTASSDRECTSLRNCDVVTARNANGKEYITKMATDTSDFECETLTVCSGQQKFEVVPPSLTSDRVCSQYPDKYNDGTILEGFDLFHEEADMSIACKFTVFPVVPSQGPTDWKTRTDGKDFDESDECPEDQDCVDVEPYVRLAGQQKVTAVCKDAPETEASSNKEDDGMDTTLIAIVAVVAVAVICLVLGIVAVRTMLNRNVDNTRSNIAAFENPMYGGEFTSSAAAPNTDKGGGYMDVAPASDMYDDPTYNMAAAENLRDSDDSGDDV
eukprot:m.21857 g.21857  ORF g.21857 m.21857 type:complete len:962 (-) comp7260_c0_seq1:85-2970(-)